MAAKDTKEQPVKFVDDPLAQEIYASAASGFFVANGNITITFESLRPDHSDKPGPLTPVERFIIRQHPCYSHRILSTVPGLGTVNTWA